MLVSVEAGPYRLRGVSLGGIYTSIQVPELGVLFDAGMPHRALATTDDIFLSHAHADHLGGLFTLLGIRGLLGKPKPRLYFPAQVEEPLLRMMELQTTLQRYEIAVHPVPLRPGDEVCLKGDLHARAFRTHHIVPSLGYELFRRVKKLREEFQSLPGHEIGARRKRGEDLFHTVERIELAYATDTLPRVFETHPSLLEARVLVLECTFLDARKKRDAARRGCHVHLDDLLEARPAFQNEKVVLMHFSQLYDPRRVREILDERLPPEWKELIVPFAPASRRHWPY